MHVAIFLASIIIPLVYLLVSKTGNSLENDIHRAALIRHLISVPESLRDIDDIRPTLGMTKNYEELLEPVLKQDIENIKYLNNPTVFEQVFAVQISVYALKYIKNPCIEAIIEGTSEHPWVTYRLLSGRLRSGTIEKILQRNIRMYGTIYADLTPDKDAMRYELEFLGYVVSHRNKGQFHEFFEKRYNGINGLDKMIMDIGYSSYFYDHDLMPAVMQDVLFVKDSKYLLDELLKQGYNYNDKLNTKLLAEYPKAIKLFNFYSSKVEQEFIRHWGVDHELLEEYRELKPQYKGKSMEIPNDLI